MEINKRFVISKSNKNKVYADEIYEYFGRQIKYPVLMVMMKNKGPQFVYDTYLEVKKSDCANSVALFMWKLKQVKVVDN